MDGKGLRMVLQTSGVGHSSPVLWGEKLFTTCASESTGEQFVLCLDAKSGKKLWQKNFPSKVYPHHKFNSFASATPCVDSEYAFVSWTTKESNDLLCLDHNGSLFGEDFGRFQTQHGKRIFPVVEGEVVVVTHDHEVESSILCLDRKTGRTLWKTDRDGSKPFIHSPRLPNWNRGEAAIRKQLEISWLLWSGRTDRQSPLGNGPGHIGFAERILPVFAQGLFFASCGSGGRGSRLVAIRPPSNPAQSPQVEYAFEEKRPLRVDSSALRGHAFFDLRRRDRILLENHNRRSSLARAFGWQLFRFPHPRKRESMDRFA